MVTINRTNINVLMLQRYGLSVHISKIADKNRDKNVMSGNVWICRSGILRLS